MDSSQPTGIEDADYLSVLRGLAAAYRGPYISYEFSYKVNRPTDFKIISWVSYKPTYPRYF